MLDPVCMEAVSMPGRLMEPKLSTSVCVRAFEPLKSFTPMRKLPKPLPPAAGATESHRALKP